jgi:hypothetical protein
MTPLSCVNFMHKIDQLSITYLKHYISTNLLYLMHYIYTNLLYLKHYIYTNLLGWLD